MSALAGPLLIACSFLVLGGAAKAATPLPTRRALYALGVPSAGWLVRSMGATEVALGVATVVVGGVALPAMVACAYLGFAGFVVFALRSGAVASCGCFGAAATPPSILHVVFNLAFAAVAFASIGVAGFRDTVAEQPAGGIPLIALAALGTYLAFVAFTVLPAVHPTAAPARAFHLADKDDGGR